MLLLIYHLMPYFISSHILSWQFTVSPSTNWSSLPTLLACRTRYRGLLPHLLPFLLHQLTGARARASAEDIDPHDDDDGGDGGDGGGVDPQATNATAQIQALRVLALLGRGQGLGSGRGLEKGGMESDGGAGGKREEMFLSLLAAAMFALGMTATAPSSSALSSSLSSSLTAARSTGGIDVGSSADDVVDGGGGGGDVGGVALWAITEVCRSLTGGNASGTRASAGLTRASSVGARARAWRVWGEEGVVARCMATVLQTKPRTHAHAHAGVGAVAGAGVYGGAPTVGAGTVMDVDGVQGRAAVTILLAVAQVKKQTNKQTIYQSIHVYIYLSIYQSMSNLLSLMPSPFNFFNVLLCIQAGLVPCRAVTSCLLPPLLDLIATTSTTAATVPTTGTSTSPRPSPLRASPAPRAVASALHAIHRLLQCVAQVTRASMSPLLYSGHNLTLPNSNLSLARLTLLTLTFRT